MYPWVEALRGQIIISCQAGTDEPLHGPHFMAAMARAAAEGGAAGIRANGEADVAAICSAVDLLVIGINKVHYFGFEVFITPTFEDAQAVVRAGAKLVALDGTSRPRPGGESLEEIVTRIHTELHVPVMADLSCLDDALASEAAGVDFLGTTLSGYTNHGRPAIEGPDLDFISELVANTHKPVIAEGRFYEPRQVAEAFARGAFAVVIGGAVTRPQEITRRFVAAVPARE
ncbi:MAG: N-acetylmannosamine-6-phosphate 2-epimerase [Anaerolineae bacterium]|nr:N-acetylmannosamine-6-phosphate 2-epimerase [Anaerolineae bacterium]